jgi:hypothetical protein
MEAQKAYNLTDLLTHVISNMAQAVAERPGETQTQRLARAQLAAQTILAFLPCDAIEAMIAGHCVMFHELIVDAIRTTLAGELDAARRATRANIVALDKAFGNNLRRLECYRKREPAVGVAETEIEPHRSHASAQAGAAETQAVRDNPSAHSADDARPSETTQMPGLNRQARRAMLRRANKETRPRSTGIEPAGGNLLTGTKVW